MRIKNGMGGSRNGKSRSESTENLKLWSKTKRRRIDKKIVVSAKQNEVAEILEDIKSAYQLLAGFDMI